MIRIFIRKRLFTLVILLAPTISVAGDATDEVSEPPASYEMFQEQIEESRLDDAARTILRIAEEDPDHDRLDDMRFQLGEIHLKIWEGASRQKALELFSTFVTDAEHADSPLAPEALLHRAKLLALLTRFGEAKQAFWELMQSDDPEIVKKAFGRVDRMKLLEFTDDVNPWMRRLVIVRDSLSLDDPVRAELDGYIGSLSQFANLNVKSFEVAHREMKRLYFTKNALSLDGRQEESKQWREKLIRKCRECLDYILPMEVGGQDVEGQPGLKEYLSLHLLIGTSSFHLGRRDEALHHLQEVLRFRDDPRAMALAYDSQAAMWIAADMYATRQPMDQIKALILDTLAAGKCSLSNTMWAIRLLADTARAEELPLLEYLYWRDFTELTDSPGHTVDAQKNMRAIEEANPDIVEQAKGLHSPAWMALEDAGLLFADEDGKKPRWIHWRGGATNFQKNQELLNILAR